MQQPPLSEREAANATRIINFVTGNLHKHYSPAFLAKHFEQYNVTPYFINKRLPLALAHKTLSQFLHEYRMQKAIELLHQNIQVKAIYFQLGYKSQSAFLDAFKKRFGEYPETYMRKR